MESAAYAQFSEQLLSRVSADARVIGLVALGSFARADYQPDRYSDHDFFLVTEPGAQEAFRRDLSWLPRHDAIALSYRETEHGLKVLYPDPHLIEFAVFDREELNLARINRYRVLLDRGGIEGVLAGVRAKSDSSSVDGRPDHFHAAQVLTILYVGVGRWRRGERLSGHHFVRTAVLYHLVPLIVRHVPSARKSILDNLDPFRRFDLAYPELGGELADLLASPVPNAARGILDILERVARPAMTDFPAAGAAVVRAFLEE